MIADVVIVWHTDAYSASDRTKHQIKFLVQKIEIRRQRKIYEDRNEKVRTLKELLQRHEKNTCFFKDESKKTRTQWKEHAKEYVQNARPVPLPNHKC